MDLYIDRPALSAALARVVPATGNGKASPALAHVLLEATDGRLSLTATDTVHTMRHSVAARLEAPGALSVDARLLAQAIKAAAGPVVRLSGQNSQLSIEVGAARYHLHALTAADFPPLQQADPGEAIRVSSADLADLVDSVKAAVSADDARYGLNGAHVEHAGGLLRLVATDGGRLHLCEVPTTGGTDIPAGMLLSRDTLAHWGRLDGEVSIAFGDRAVVATAGDTQVTARLVDGAFPDYRQVLPESAPATVATDRAALSAALKRASIMATSRNHGVRLAFEADQIVITASNVDSGDMSEAVPATLTGEGMATGFNAGFMLDALVAAGGADIEIGLTGELGPAMIRTPGDERGVFVVMPMRLD